MYTKENAIQYLVDSNNKLSVIITGNGDPEKGLCRQVALIGERQHSTLERLDSIKDELKGVNENYNVLLKEVIEIKSFNNGTKSEKELRKEKIRTRVMIASAIIAGLLLVTTLIIALLNRGDMKDALFLKDSDSKILYDQKMGTISPVTRAIHDDNWYIVKVDSIK